MKRIIGVALVLALATGYRLPVQAEDNQDAAAILDKAIKALGGAEKLGAVKAATWKGNGSISFGGNDNKFTSSATFQGLDHYRGEFEGEFNGNKIKGMTVINGDKGWRKFGDNNMEMDKDAVANEKRTIYLQIIPSLLIPLKGQGFKIAAGGEEKVGDKAAVGIKVTPADGKEFTLFFDKETGLPVKQVAKVVGFMGDEFTQETTYDGYKEFGGIKKATKVVNKRDGEKFLDLDLTEFKVLDNVDPKTFSEPE